MTAKAKKKKKPEPVTGTYKFDRERGEMVLVSGKTPKVASKGRAAAPSSPCGGGGCGRGPCGRA